MLRRLLRAAAGVSRAAAAAATLGGTAAPVTLLPLLPVLRLLRLPLVQRRLRGRNRFTLRLVAAGWRRLWDPLDLQLCVGVLRGAILGATARAEVATILLDAIIAKQAYLIPARQAMQKLAGCAFEHASAEWQAKQCLLVDVLRGDNQAW